MVDNATSGGVLIHTDEVGGAHMQKMKLMDGTPDSTAPIVGTSADGLYVDVRKVRVAVAVTGPVTNTELRATAIPVSGPVTDAQMRATALPVSGPVTDAQMRATPVVVREGQVATATVSSQVASTTAVSLAANAARRGMMIENNSGQKMRVRYGAGASAALYTVSLGAGSYWEMPQPIYTGIVSLIWDAADAGRAQITELS